MYTERFSGKTTIKFEDLFYCENWKRTSICPQQRISFENVAAVVEPPSRIFRVHE